MKIEKKIWPEFFQKIVEENKTCELRLADFECYKDDTLILREWNPKTKQYTGKSIEKKITYVMKTKNTKFWTKEEIEKYGFQIICFK